MGLNDVRLTLEGEREILIERDFMAPAEIVFRAWTDPDLVKLWWAPRDLGVSIVTCEAEIRVGGRYRYVLENAGGELIGFTGHYREITPPSRLVYTQYVEGMEKAGEALVEVNFRSSGARTLVSSRETYPSAEVRHMAVTSGMEQGLRLTWEQLSALLPSLVP